MLAARRFVLRGRVQGVGLRFFAEEAARREGVSGWAQNQPDGSVEIFAEGDLDALDRFEMKIRRGPPGARVHQFVVTVEAPSGRSGEFTIRR